MEHKPLQGRYIEENISTQNNTQLASTRNRNKLDKQEKNTKIFYFDFFAI